MSPKPPVRLHLDQELRAELEYTHPLSVLWQELHTEQHATPEWFAQWLSRVPHVGCGCQTWLADYLLDNPPRYDDWFAWTWALHNAVNIKLGKPMQSLSDARACWLNEAPRSCPRLVITVATTAAYLELLAITRPTMEAYAAKCNADFIALTNKQHDHWHGDKFRVNDFVAQYDQTLFLDCDVVVKESCPDLFALYPDCIAMHDDLAENRRVTASGWAGEELTAVLASQKLDSYPLTRILNTGVVLCTKTKHPWMPPVYPLPKSHCGEQFWVDHQAGPECVSLPLAFNLQWWMKHFAQRAPDAHIIHLANCRDGRPGLAQRIADGAYG